MANVRGKTQWPTSILMLHPGAVSAAISQFRKSFPAKVSADTLRKLSIAPNNESYVINTLRFIGAIDKEGNKTEQSTTAFSQHEDAAFQKALGEMVKKAYIELFKLSSDVAWELELDKLISFFPNQRPNGGRCRTKTGVHLPSIGRSCGPWRGSCSAETTGQTRERLRIRVRREQFECPPRYLPSRSVPWTTGSEGRWP